MAENNSILGTLGTVSFWAAAGTAGTLAYRRAKEMQGFAKATKSVVTQAVRPTQTIVNNLKSTGFENMKFVSTKTSPIFTAASNATELFNLQNNLSAFGISAAETQELNEIILKANQLTNTKFHIQAKPNNTGAAATITLQSEMGHSISLGNRAINGQIVHASSSSIHNKYVPSYMDRSQVESVIAGSFNDITSISTVDHNLAQLKTIKQELSGFSNMHPRELKKRIGNVTTWFAANEEEISSNLSMIDTKLNTVIPIIYDENNRLIPRKNSVFNKHVNVFKDNLYKAFRKSGFNQAGFMQSIDDIASGAFLNPNTPTKQQSMFNAMVGHDQFQGSHEFNQLFQRNTRFANPTKFASKELQAMQGIANIESLNMYRVAKDDKMWNTILAKGFGSNGIPMPGMYDDGILMSVRTANRKIRSPHGFSLNMDSGAANISNELENLVNTLVAHHVGKANYSVSPLSSNKSIQLKLIHYNKRRSLGKDMTQINQIRQDIIQDIVSENNGMSNLIQDYTKDTYGGGEFSFKRFFGKKNVNFMTDKVGKHGFDKNVNFIMKDIALTPTGMSFGGEIEYPFSQGAGKVWGAAKAFMSGQMANKNAVFVHRIASENPAIANEIMNNSFTPKQMKSKIKAWRKAYKNIYNAIPNDINVTNMNFRQHKLGDPSYMKFISELETAAIGKNNPYFNPDNNFYSYVSSIGQPESFYGFDMNRMHTINRIQPNRLRAQGINSAADFIESNFETSTLNNLLDTFQPMFGDPSSNHYAIDINDFRLRDEKVMGRLFGENMQEAIEQARQLTIKQLSKDNVSAQTRFFIKINEKQSIPLPFVDSNYSFAMNENRFDEAGEPLLKGISSKIRKLINNTLGDNAETFNADYAELSNQVAEILGNPNAFTHTYGIDKSGKSFVSQAYAQNEGILNKNFLDLYERELGPGGRDKISKLFAEYGVDYNTMHSEILTGVSNKRYEFETNRMGIKGSFAERAKTSYNVIGREPAYAHQGMTVSHLLPIEEINSRLLSMHPNLAGADSQIKDFLKTQISDNAININEAGRMAAGIDLDLDPVKLISITDDATRLKMIDEYKHMNRFMSSIYTDKGIMKSDTATMKQWLREAADAEKTGISQSYNKALRYQMPFNNYEGILTGNDLMIANKKAALNSFFTNLPENFIGGKMAQNMEDTNRIMSIFDENLPIKDRVANMRTIAKDMKFRRSLSEFGVTDDMIGQQVFGSYFSEEELGKILQSGQDVPEIIVDYLTGSIKGPKAKQKFIDLQAAMREHPFGSKIRSSEIKNIEMAMTNYDVPGKYMNTIADIAEDVIPKVLKNRTVQGLAAASLIAGVLMQSPDTNMRNQDVREESQPKGVPGGAQAIDPPVGIVAQPRPKGLRFNIRGRLPEGVSGASLNRGLSDMGMASTTTYIDKNTRVDEGYVKQLNEEEKYNKWNIG